jgi:hypothetical protein
MNEFSRAYQDFTQHYVEIDEHKFQMYSQMVENYWSEIEKKAEEFQVTCDYYLAEFV